MNNRFYLNEEERKRILQMHKPRLNEKILEEQSLMDIQNIILDNGGYVGKLGADNKLGPDTLNAIYNALTKGFAKNNTATAQGTPAQGTPAQGTPAQGTPAQGTPAQGTSSTETTQTTTTEKIPTTPLKDTTVSNNISGQQLATGPIKSGQEIRQDYRQQQRQERQGARQKNQNVRKTEQDLKNLQATYQRLQGKMTPSQKMAYENQIKQLKTELGQA